MISPNETVTDVKYENGMRVSTIIRTETRAEDAEALGNCYFRLADAYRRLEVETDDAVLTSLENDKTILLNQIETYKTYLSGYDEE